MNTIISILIFLVIFSIIVIGHEFGHYAVAKRCGIRVKEFDIGMGPAVFRKKGKETDLAIRALPIGGACIFDGMDEMYGPEDEENRDSQSASIRAGAGQLNANGYSSDGASENTGSVYGGSVDDGAASEVDVHAFPNASLGSRFATILAGPMANFIMGLVFAIIIVAFCGTDLPTVYKIMPDSAAEEAGIQAGDTITRINGESIHIYREVQLASMMNYGEPLKITYLHDGEKHTVTLTPKYDADANRYYIGLVGSGEQHRCGPLEVFEYGFYEAGYWVRATFQSLGLIFRGHFSADDLSGPVGIVKVVGDTYEETKPYGVSTVVLSFLNLTTLLSINLGIMNLLPIPALDGGRLLILIIEAIRGKKMAPEKEGYVTLAGAIALMALMVFVMFNDIGKFFR